MTATDDSPSEGHESIDPESIGPEELVDEWRMLRGYSDDGVAVAVEKQKQEAVVALDTLKRALVDEDVPLTDEKVDRVALIGNAFRSLSDSLVDRVPEEHQER